MSAHTPGHWRRGVADDGYFIATGALIPDIAQRITSEADAALIEAAPDMLAALIKAEDILSYLGSQIGISPSPLETIRAAIAKATGAPL